MTSLRWAGWILILNLMVVGFLFAEEQAIFGRKDNSEAGLIGILYDFKQTQKRSPLDGNDRNYTEIVGEFFSKDWSESVLNRYFRATRPLYATQIFIPLMDAGQAPKAFDLENVIKPSAWVVVYKGQVAPPEDGVYRFIAYADDIIAVAVNGKNVLLGGRHDTLDYLKSWKVGTEGEQINAANGVLSYGEWMPLKKDEPIDLDVLVGERPGGLFAAFFLYEKQGASYPKNSRGERQFPVFQLAPASISIGAADKEPPFSVSDSVWKGYQ